MFLIRILLGNSKVNNILLIYLRVFEIDGGMLCYMHSLLKLEKSGEEKKNIFEHVLVVKCIIKERVFV